MEIPEEDIASTRGFVLRSISLQITQHPTNSCSAQIKTWKERRCWRIMGKWEKWDKNRGPKDFWDDFWRNRVLGQNNMIFRNYPLSPTYRASHSSHWIPRPFIYFTFLPSQRPHRFQLPSPQLPTPVPTASDSRPHTFSAQKHHSRPHTFPLRTHKASPPSTLPANDITGQRHLLRRKIVDETTGGHLISLSVSMILPSICLVSPVRCFLSLVSVIPFVVLLSVTCFSYPFRLCRPLSAAFCQGFLSLVCSSNYCFLIFRWCTMLCLGFLVTALVFIFCFVYLAGLSCISL